MVFRNFLIKIKEIFQFGNNSKDSLELKNNEKEKIGFNELQNWIRKKENEVRIQESKVFDLLKERITLSEKEIKDKLDNLKKTEIASEKAEGRVETIVKENLENYMTHVENLLDKLSEIKTVEGKDLGEVISEINSAFFYFEKKSYINYQKASHLVKNELFEVSRNVKILSKELKKIFENNKEVVNSSKAILDIIEKLVEMNKEKESVSRLKRDLDEIDGLIKKLSERKEQALSDIDNLKKSEEYKEKLQNIQRVNEISSEIKKKVFLFKELVDFKKLRGIFHSDKKKMDIVKDFDERFSEILFEEKDLFIGLLNEAGIKNSEIDEKLKELEEKNKEISELRINIVNDKIKPIEEEVSRIEGEIQSLNDEREKIKKNLEKPDSRFGEILDFVKERVNWLGGLLTHDNTDNKSENRDKEKEDDNESGEKESENKVERKEKGNL